MEKTVHFTYKSIGNFVKLLATIRFEQTESPEDISIWHERFDDDEADALFENFLVELFPEGKTIQVEDIETVIFRAKRFLETDEKAQNIRNGHIKRKSTYWVYFKPTNKVYPCGYAKHSKIIHDICADFFKGFDDIDVNYLKRFIMDNFEICSDNSTVERIAKDAEFIRYSILFNTDAEKKG